MTPNLTPVASNLLKKILIIDDDVHLAATLALGLEAHGFQTLVAHDAAAGWKLAHAHLPDLILSDIDMPGKDGRRLLQDLRADAELSDRQFVLMTGKQTFGNQRTAMDLGADDFLLKPFSLTDLLHCVEARFKRADLSRRLDDSALDRLRVSLRSTLPHEFFTPLASILGLSDLCAQDLEKLSREEIRQDLRDIHEAGRRLHRTLRNYLLLLELEPAEPARQVPVLEPADVTDAVSAGAVAAVDRHGRSGDLAMEVAGASLRANPVNLATLIEELVDNACRYSRAGTPIKVKSWCEGSLLKIMVTDAGRGLTPQQLASLDLSWRQPRDAGEKQALGLGLVLVHRIIKPMGGTLRLESTDGAGTIVHLAIPVGLT